MARLTCAALIFDVLASTGTAQVRSLLSRNLRRFSNIHLGRKAIDLPYAITAGDEFQTVTTRLDEIPNLILELRIGFRPLGLWVGVGIGDIPQPIVEPANRLTGEAFVRARDALEALKAGKAHKFESLTAFRSPSGKFDLVANSLYGLHDSLVSNVSSKQWETISAYWKKRRVDRAARALGVSESTVSRNLRRGRFWQMEETAVNMARIIASYFQ